MRALPVLGSLGLVLTLPLALAAQDLASFEARTTFEVLDNGLTLLVSIAIASWAQQRRNLSIKRRIAERQLAPEPGPVHPPSA